LSIVFELGGGIAILLGWRTRFGALLLFVFTLLVTFAIHHFWSYPSTAAQMQMIQFMKNLAILGGCLYIICFGAGGYSIDARRQNRVNN
jgi:putative oxidoreductase